ncbi:hypothetical protein SLEP1_g29118 [Rubroshorea leprosula]|uniref:Uncharacterized protein n=1 Tax=Rubroshorea leprosula TaxID=152421 RepID=A0AAV5K6T2_9ROSI|nr:hypothetical protein SLEP1_g29118 [Rubroshorea leprosula]
MLSSLWRIVETDEEGLQVKASKSQQNPDEVSSSGGSPIYLTGKVFTMASCVLCKAAFANKCTDQDLFISLAREALAATGGFDLSDLFPALEFLHVTSGAKARIAKIHRMIDRVAGTSKGMKEDLVDVLRRLQGSGKFEFPITANNDMFTAGMDTAGYVYSWSGYSNNRLGYVVMEKVQTEMREAFIGKKDVREADIQELTYLNPFDYFVGDNLEYLPFGAGRRIGIANLELPLAHLPYHFY